MRLSKTAIASLRPQSVVGGISNDEAYFLYNIVLQFAPTNSIELGVASGWSSSIILLAINELKSHNTGAEFTFRGIDCDTHCYYDRNLQVGYVIDEVIGDKFRGELLRGGSVFDLPEHYAERSLQLAFIDANHKHPYPALDLLAVLPYLADEAVVVLHDTNLPLINRDFPSHGVKYLFDEIQTQFKFTCPGEKRHAEVSNMGALVLQDRIALQAEIESTLRKFDFEMPLQAPYRNVA